MWRGHFAGRFAGRHTRRQKAITPMGRRRVRQAQASQSSETPPPAQKHMQDTTVLGLGDSPCSQDLLNTLDQLSDSDGTLDDPPQACRPKRATGDATGSAASVAAEDLTATQEWPPKLPPSDFQDRSRGPCISCGNYLV